MRTRSGALRAKARGATHAAFSARFTLKRCRVQLGYMPIQISVLPREVYPVLAVAPVPVWRYLDHSGHLLPHLWCPPGVQLPQVVVWSLANGSSQCGRYGPRFSLMPRAHVRTSGSRALLTAPRFRAGAQLSSSPH